MRPLLVPVAASIAWLLAASAATAGSADVTGRDPAHWTDAGSSRFEAEDTLQRLGAHLKRLAATGLADGQRLSVELTDVDLAGRLLPARGLTERRVLRSRADWPRISLHYRLEAGGQVLGEGDDTLADMNYLQTSAVATNTAPLAHETRLLDRWFRERIAPLAARAP